MKVARLHGQAIFGVVSVSDTGTGTTRRILVSSECPLFYFIFFSFLRPALTRLRRVWHASSEEKKNHRFWVWEIILRNPPLKFSTHPPSDLCRCPLSLAGARSRRSASSIDVEWRHALSLPTISLSRRGLQVRPPLSVFFFFFFPSDINFGDWMVMGEQIALLRWVLSSKVAFYVFLVCLGQTWCWSKRCWLVLFLIYSLFNQKKKKEKKG